MAYVDDLNYLVTVADLETRLDTTLDRDLADQACAVATGIITGYTGQNILWRTYTHELTVQYGYPPQGGLPEGEWLSRFQGVVGVVNLPQRPVITVNTVEADGTTLASTDWQWDAARGQLLLDNPIVDVATVTYTAGYETIPADIKAVALAIAADEVTNPRGVVNERLADYSVTYASGNTAGLSKRQQFILDRYRGAGGTIRTVQ